MSCTRAQIRALAAALDAAAEGERLVYLTASIPARDLARRGAEAIRATGEGNLLEDEDAVEVAAIAEAAARIGCHDIGNGWLRIQALDDGSKILAENPDRIIADPDDLARVLAAIADLWRGAQVARRRR